MTLERLACLITDAAGRGRAVPAFHVVTLEQAEAITGGAADASVPEDKRRTSALLTAIVG